MTKVLCLIASARSGSGSEVMANKFIEGLESVSPVEVHKVNVMKERTDPGSGCGACVHSYEHFNCSLHDKTFDLLNEFINADIVIFSFPVYWYAMPGELKNFIDRMTALYDTRDYTAKADIKNKFVNKKVVSLVNCAGEEDYCKQAEKIVNELIGYLSVKYYGHLYFGDCCENNTIPKSLQRQKTIYEFGQNVMKK